MVLGWRWYWDGIGVEMVFGMALYGDREGDGVGMVMRW